MSPVQELTLALHPLVNGNWGRCPAVVTTGSSHARWGRGCLRHWLGGMWRASLAGSPMVICSLLSPSPVPGKPASLVRQRQAPSGIQHGGEWSAIVAAVEEPVEVCGETQRSSAGGDNGRWLFRSARVQFGGGALVGTRALTGCRPTGTAEWGSFAPQRARSL